MSNSIKRLHNLDYLRGLAAFGIMVFHLTSWSFGKYPSETFMARVGIYGVSIFYVLSGLTLFHVYFHKLKPEFANVLTFFRKRIFRIFPLLWLTSIVAILISRKLPDPYVLFLNLSGIFGFVKWDAYFSPGVWSIGNELAFYAFFPFFVFFIKHSKPLMLILSLIITAFTFIGLDDAVPLGKQWKNYINPLNQVFLFLSGFLMGLLFKNINLNKKLSIIVLLSSFALFYFYPVSGYRINLVTGINRLVFTSCCFFICLSFYKSIFTFPNLLHNILAKLGEISYSVYLLHPIVYKITGVVLALLGRHFFETSAYSKIAISALLTLILSYFIYEYFEKYFIKMGKRKLSLGNLR